MAIVVPALLAACGSLNTDETAGMATDKLYEDARDDAAAGNWDRAAKLYERLEARTAGTPLSLAIPVKVGLSLNDYYELDGNDNKFGFVDAGLLLTVPFTKIPTQFGSWNVHGGVNFLGFGDTTKYFNNGDAGQVVVSGGIGMSY